MKRIGLSLPVLLVCCAVLSAADSSPAWRQWRGNAAAGAADEGAYPAQLGEEQLLWKAELPGVGCSTPIVWNERIYVTAPVDGRDALLAFDWSGKQLWQATFGKEIPGKHRNGSGANPSPVTDGKSIFVNFKSGTLAAVGLDGKVRWQTNLVKRFGPDTLFWDHGTSPVLTDDNVVMARMHQGESWLAAFDKSTGELKWKQPRNFETLVENDHGYSTPLVMEYEGREALLVWGAEHLTMHDASTGNTLWTCGDFNPDGNRLWPSIASPVVAGDVAVIAYGRNDRGIPRLHGIRLTGKGDVTKTNRLWKRDDLGTFVPTPVSSDGKFYLVGDKGKVSCLDPETGKSLWTERLPRSSARFYASPLVADGKLYAAREDGVVFVVDIASGYKLLSENDLGESIIASPVAVGGRLFLRGSDHLFCLGVK